MTSNRAKPDKVALRTDPKPRLSRSRAAVSNGSRVFAIEERIDQRSAVARRFRDLINDLSNDLGGVEVLSTAKQQLIRRAALLCLDLERREAEALTNLASEFDVSAYAVASSHCRRLFESLGLDRVTRDATSLSNIVAAVKASSFANDRARKSSKGVE